MKVDAPTARRAHELQAQLRTIAQVLDDERQTVAAAYAGMAADAIRANDYSDSE
jgi:hypothetical protein